MAQAIEHNLFAILDRQKRPPEDIAFVRKAYEFAYKAHDGQLRKSEDPYIIHPVEVACLLAELNGDKQIIAAGLMHDVLEDCDVKAKEMADIFGKDVTQIVEGVTKLGKFSFSSKEERQAENFRKLIVAIAEDVRVVIVKLADRLHNMRTLDYMTPRKQAEVAKETLEIFAPLANRFGLGHMKWELEDLGLKYLHPEEFAQIEQLVTDSRQDREMLITQVVDKLRADLDSRGISATISGRPKHLFGIWKKMKGQEKSFEELYDVSAIRVIINSDDKNYCELGSDPDTQKCYEVMGVVHSIFRPIPGRFKDYIAMPKFNSYQSLHTAVIGPNGKPVEIQIRTQQMHHIAEYGIAAHWAYKESGDSVKADADVNRKLAWLRQLVDWQQDLVDAQEYLDTVKMDLFADEVFVFSPRGDVFDLPSNSTPIDFAYRVHTDIGHRCIGARINDRIVPLNTVMKNGDIVEVITSKNAHPTMDWLNFAATHSAKSRIRQWFKKHHREEHIQQGRQMLEAGLGKSTFDEFIKSEELLKEAGKKLNITEANDILAAVGYGELSLNLVANKIHEKEQQENPSQKGFPNLPVHIPKPSNISSLGGLLHHLAKCCQPVPGEEIIGIVTRGSGIAVHRTDCNNILKADVGRQMAVDWSRERNSAYPAGLQVECLDRVGIAGDILKKLSDNKINIKDLRVEIHKETKTATISLLVDVLDIDQLTKVSQSISMMSDVLRVQRKDHRKKNTVAKPANTVKKSNVTPLKIPKTNSSLTPSKKQLKLSE
jgi:guanosine-3',5'-bis(diphosphate) 3'-pyrophosphohydrolase